MSGGMIAERALPCFQGLIKAISASTVYLKFQSANAQHLLAASLHATIMEQARAIDTLMESGNATGSFIVLRSMLEAAVDLFNLISDPTYSEFMQSAALHEQRRILQPLTDEDRSNPYLADFFEHWDDAQAALTSKLTKLKELKARNIKPLQIRKRFERAKRLDLYKGPYAYLCWHSHNNINILEERHLQQTSTGFAITYSRSPDDHDVLLIIDTSAGLIFHSVAFLYQLLGLPSSELNGVTAALNQLRAVWKSRFG
jgi:Family of unknown function (DUF5677)